MMTHARHGSFGRGFCRVAYVCVVAATLAGCDSNEIEVGLPNGYRLVSISGGPTVSIIDASGAPIVGTLGWSILTYGISDDGVIIGSVRAKRTRALRYFLFDTRSGGVQEFGARGDLQAAWEGMRADPLPEFKHWSVQP